MRTAKLLLAFFVFALLGLALFGISATAAQDEVAHIRWDIVALTFDENGIAIIDPGGAAYAFANDGTAIKIIGTGTFGPGLDDEVTGGGAWTTYDTLGAPVTMGTFTVTSLVSYAESAGYDPTPLDLFVDHILEETGSEQSDYRSGVAVLAVSFEDELGNTLTTGALTISCHLAVDTPSEVFEGVTVTMGYASYWNRVAPVPDNTFSLTQFTVVHPQ